ncbi:MAG TPA: protein kinase [Gemmatimonadaceae bacterium]|nr:protein kinase [Gemmatimonadaceae bacterium]
MTPERWAELSPLLDAVLDQSADERERYIEQISEHDPALRADLERLLYECSRNDSLIDRGAAERFALLLDESVSEMPAVLADRFVLEREIGRGGMATVFLAHDRKHERPVAIKVLRREVAASVGAHRFLNEIATAARLQHPHIVPVHDSGEAEGFVYYVMPYVAGETLRARLERQPQLKLDEARHIAREVADALDYAHRNGIVHRDIKPENILLSNGHALVLDFGIARAASESADGERITLPGVAVGTPAYMSPEQATGGHTIDGRADIYALGCVLYEMLAGHPPFLGTTHREILGRHSLDPVPSLRTSRPDVPLFVESAIEKALAKTPVDRYDHAAAFISAISSDSSLQSRGRLRRQGWWIGAGMVVALAVVASLGLWRTRESHASITATEPQPSVAVLAFRNISGDSTSDAVSEGISEEIATTIATVSGLNVKSPRSSFSLDENKLSIQEIGAALNVHYLVDGSVQHDGNRLRVHVSLLSAANDSTLWVHSYDGAFGDVFNMQDEIARGIASELRLRFDPVLAANVSTRSSSNAQAHELYLRGRFFFQRRDSASLRKAREYFTAAIEADSNYALAYAGLSDAYSHSSVFGYAAPRINMPRARAYAERALSLDSTLAEAHTSRAFIATFYEWDWARARHEFEKALALDPAYPSTHLWKAWYLLARDSTNAAIAEGRNALALEPFLVLTNTRLISLLYYGRQYQEALRQSQKTFELDSMFFQLGAERGRVLVELHRCDEALQSVSRIPMQTPAMLGGTRGYTYAKCGHRADALAELDHLTAAAKSGKYVSHYALAVVQAALGNNDAAFTELDKGLAERSWCMFLIEIEPAFDGLRNDPRFAVLARKIGLAS